MFYRRLPRNPPPRHGVSTEATKRAPSRSGPCLVYTSFNIFNISSLGCSRLRELDRAHAVLARSLCVPTAHLVGGRPQLRKREPSSSRVQAILGLTASRTRPSVGISPFVAVLAPGSPWPRRPAKTPGSSKILDKIGHYRKNGNVCTARTSHGIPSSSYLRLQVIPCGLTIFNTATRQKLH